MTLSSPWPLPPTGPTFASCSDLATTSNPLPPPIWVSLSISKTELIHCRTPDQRDRPGTHRLIPIALDDQLFHPVVCLRWLGYCLNDNHAFSPHFTRRLVLALSAFAAVQCLFPHRAVLVPHLAHRLSVSLILPTLQYGADLLSSKATMLGKMEVFWRQVECCIMNSFRSTSVMILAAKACLPPISVLVPHWCRMAALLLACSPTTVNPAAGRLCPSFPSLLGGRAPDSHKALCTHLLPNVMLLIWQTDLSRPPVRTPLPLDFLANSIVPLLQGLDFTLLPFPHLLPDPTELQSAESQRAI